MKIKKALSVFLVVAMLLALLAACSTAPADPESSTSPSTSADENSPSGTQNTVEIEFWMFDMSGTGGTAGTDEALEKVESAINEISEAEIGVHVNFTRIAMADYGTQLALAISNSETVDLAALTPSGAASVSTMLSNGSMKDITALLDEYGTDIKTLLGEDMLATTSVDGAVYAVPNYRMWNTELYLAFRSDALENAGVLELATNMTTWAELETVLQAIKDAGETYGLGGRQRNEFGCSNAVLTGTNLTDAYCYDALGDSTSLIWSDQEGNVACKYDREDVEGHYKMLADWYSKGYIWPDSPHSSEDATAMVVQNTYAGYLTATEFNFEINPSERLRTDATVLKLADGMISTTAGRNWCSFVPSSAAQPEAAIKFLNLMYTNAEVMNLLIWGIEGENYVVLESGEADYPEGLDASTCGYHGNDYAFGNQFLCLPWVGVGGDFREKALASTEAAPRSVYCGLSVPTDDIANVISALSSTVEEYRGQITCGLYTEELYAEFLEKLDAADIDAYVDLYQTAVTEFMS